MLILILLLSGCATIIRLDEPDSSQFNKMYSNVNYTLNGIDVKNVGELYIYADGSTTWAKANKPIEDYYYESLSTTLRAIGLREISNSNIEITAEIIDVSLSWNSGINVPVEGKIEVKLSIEDTKVGSVTYTDTFFNSFEKIAWGGGLPAYGMANDVIEEAISQQMQDIVNTIDFSKILSFQADETDAASEPEIKESGSIKPASRLIDRNNLPIVTVFDFEYEGISENEANFLVDFLGGALFDTGNYRIIDRTQREAILSEIEFSLSGCTDETCQLEAGKLLAADYMVVGSLGKVGSRFVINAKLIDVESGETVLSARDIYSDVDSMLDGCDELAIELSVY